MSNINTPTVSSKPTLTTTSAANYIIDHESSEDEADDGMYQGSSELVVAEDDRELGSSFYIKGDTPPLQELLSSDNLALTKYTILVRRDDVYIHTKVPAHSLTPNSTKKPTSDIIDHIPGVMFLIKDVAQKQKQQNIATNNNNRASTANIKQLVSENNNILVGSQTTLKSCYYLVWCPYSTLCTFNPDLVLHEKSNGVIITPEKYKNRLPQNNNDSSNARPGRSSSNSSIIDLSQMNSMSGTTPLNYPRNEAAYALTMRTIDISHFKKQDPTIGQHYLVISMRDETAYPPLFFHDGGLAQFIAEFNQHVSLKKSKSDSNIYFISADTSEPLAKSLNQFDFDVYFEDVYKEKDKTWQFLEWGAKITKGAREITNALFNTGVNSELELPPPPKNPSPNLAMDILQAKKKLAEEKKKAPPPVVIENLTASVCENYLDSTDDITKVEFEPVTTTSTAAATEGGSSSTAPTSATSKPVFEDNFFTPRVDPPLTRNEWLTFFDEEGRISKFEFLKERIFYGGIENDIRSEVWKFLLGYYPHNSTYAEREILIPEKKKEYEALKIQWKSISPKQESRFFLYRDRKSRIEKDVIRTDRTHPMYADESSEWLVKLNDILLSYTFYNFDLSYVQGMGDYASIMLEIMKDEVDTFWCFACLMESRQVNFELNSAGMEHQLASLGSLIKFLDLEFYNYLASVDSLNLYFCFRWVLVELKREFNFEETKDLWEKFWTQYYGNNFHLFVCYAMLQRIRNEVLTEKYRFDDILRSCIDLSGHLNLTETLQEAEKTYLHYKMQLQHEQDISERSLLL
ncbi:hypothetical protein C9374_009927 [Naegleria lovaniensis]|uniref:Rab-GAP TBC domain-containing protein n=1 Tax=Naegleria lovaniensis TaxID=51637 RepID=A0AA88KGH9_NAELO|nr:uncharacterized protein C9374_009927 [Naegleria lovaniensis]KAG2375304.1 hypothetical protein C9374_009927 [Naegleria lovaniensis]